MRVLRSGMCRLWGGGGGVHVQSHWCVWCRVVPFPFPFPFPLGLGAAAERGGICEVGR